MNKEDEIKLETFIKRLHKIGIEIRLASNIPWIYLTHVNNKVVKEKFYSEHGFTIGFYPTRINQRFRFIDTSEIFRLIRKYR